MIVFKNGNTFHLFSECRGVKGTEEVIENPRPVCGVCERRFVRQTRSADMKLLISHGFSCAEIGRELGISRQAVWSLVQDANT